MGKVITWLFGLIFGFIAAFTFMYFVTGVNQNSNGDLIYRKLNETYTVYGVTFEVTKINETKYTINIYGQKTGSVAALFTLVQRQTIKSNIIQQVRYNEESRIIVQGVSYESESAINPEKYYNDTTQIVANNLNYSFYIGIHGTDNEPINTTIEVECKELYPERVGMLEWFMNIVGSFTQENLIDSLKEPIYNIIENFQSENWWDHVTGTLRILVAPVELLVRILVWFANIVYNIIPIIFGISM